MQNHKKSARTKPAHLSFFRGSAPVSGFAASGKRVFDRRIPWLAGSTALALLLAMPSSRANQIINGDDVTVPGGHASPWTIGGDLIIGVTDNASLTIDRNGLVEVAQTVVLGKGPGGEGALTIRRGGELTSADAEIGTDLLSPGGHALVTGAGSAWTNAGSLAIGEAGELRIKDGGAVSTGSAALDGSTVVTGTGSAWTNAGSLAIGEAGELRIKDGGAVSTGSATLGGRVVVADTGSTWTNGGLLTVDGTGELRIKDGGAVSTDSATINGSALVIGLGSTWINDDSLAIGDAGLGSLSIRSGGMVGAATAVVGGGGAGSVEVMGESSNLTVGSLAVGVEGAGALSIKAAGKVESGDAIVGDLGGAGAVSVDGPGSIWNNGNLFIGLEEDSIGALSISNGGSVTTTDAGIGVYDGHGAAIVSGTGSVWTNSGELWVGDSSDDGVSIGALAVLEGGTLNNDGDAFIGSGGLGVVAVGGSSSAWNNGGDIIVGEACGCASGMGLLLAVDGGTVSAGNGDGKIVVASEADSLGWIMIGGTDAAGGPGPLDMNSFGESWLLDMDGPRTPGVLNVADVVFGDGLGVLSFNHTSHDYVFAPALWGTGVVAQMAGTTSLSADNSNFSGPVLVGGGTLAVNGPLGASELYVAPGATLAGGGSIAGEVEVADSGILAPGGAEPGTLSVGTLLLNPDSSLDFRLGLADNLTNGISARVDVADGLRLDGVLNVDDAGGFGAGVYRLFNYGTLIADDGVLIGRTPAGVQESNLTIQTSVPNQVNLIYSGGAELSFWDGGNPANRNNGVVDGGDGTWDAVNPNWTGADGAVNGAMKPQPGFAVFQSAPGTVAVDGSHGGIAVTGMQFMTSGYRIVGGEIELAGAGGETLVRVGDGTADGAGYTATIASALTGASALVKVGAGTLTLTGANTYAGDTWVKAGTLVVNGALGGTSHIMSGGRLRGSGTVGPTNVSGGTIAPGNSIGTLTVAGNLTVAPGSRYEVEVDPASGASDLVHVTGSATLNGGSVVHVGMDGTYAPLRTYTILTADGGVSGAFDTVSSNYAFLNPSLGYGARSVTLTLARNDVPFSQVGETPNQIAAGGGVESLGAGNPIHDAIIPLNPSAARAAFDSLSGEIHASAAAALQGNSALARTLPFARLRANLGAGPHSTASAALPLWAAMSWATGARSRATAMPPGPSSPPAACSWAATGAWARDGASARPWAMPTAASASTTATREPIQRATPWRSMAGRPSRRAAAI